MEVQANYGGGEIVILMGMGWGRGSQASQRGGVVSTLRLGAHQTEKEGKYSRQGSSRYEVVQRHSVCQKVVQSCYSKKCLCVWDGRRVEGWKGRR